MEERRQSREEASDGGPGQAYMIFVLMENLLDKLKLLNYESEFTQEFKLKFINRHYFALPTNPGEQFFMFSCLSAWLIRKCGVRFDTPQEFDDPNGTIASILEQAKQMGVGVSFPPSKLKGGWGDQVIAVLSRLADQALLKRTFQWKRAILLPEGEADVGSAEEDEAEVKIEEDMIAEDFEAEESDDEGEILDLEALTNNKQSVRPSVPLESEVDAVEWRMEVERVLHQLKVTLRPNDARDWRSHLEQLRSGRRSLDETTSEASAQLRKLRAALARSLDKLGSRERHLNAQLEAQISEFRSAQEGLAHASENYRAVSGGVAERARTLAQISEELDQVKQEMEERGSNMTDGKPLVNIRKALSKLRGEVSEMEVRIGVASHTLLQAKLKERALY